MNADIEIRILGPEDGSVLAHVATDVFDNPIDPALTAEFLRDPRHHIVVAIDGGVVVGFVSALDYVHPDKRPQMWINEVAVAPTHRGRGLGKAMLARLLELGRTLRCTEAWVLTDRTNAAAMALYTSSGGTEGADEGPSDATLGYTFKLS